MEIFAITLLILFSLVGFAAVFFTTFGTMIILIGAVLYAFLTQFSALTLKTLVILLILYLFGEALEYIFVILGAKKFGASNAAVVGAIIGGILGAAAGIPNGAPACPTVVKPVRIGNSPVMKLARPAVQLAAA